MFSILSYTIIITIQYIQGPVQNIIAERERERPPKGVRRRHRHGPQCRTPSPLRIRLQWQVRGLETSKPLSFLHLPLLDRSDPIWHSISYVVSLWQAIKTHSCGNAGRGIIITSRLLRLRMPLSIPTYIIHIYLGMYRVDSSMYYYVCTWIVDLV